MSALPTMHKRDWVVAGVGAALVYVAYRQWRTQRFLAEVMQTARSMAATPGPVPVNQGRVAAMAVPPRVSKKDRLMERLRREEAEKRSAPPPPTPSGDSAAAIEEQAQSPGAFSTGDPRALSGGGSGNETAALLSAASSALQPKSGGGRRGGATVQFAPAIPTNLT